MCSNDFMAGEGSGRYEGEAAGITPREHADRDWLLVKQQQPLSNTVEMQRIGYRKRWYGEYLRSVIWDPSCQACKAQKHGIA